MAEDVVERLKTSADSLCHHFRTKAMRPGALQEAVAALRAAADEIERLRDNTVAVDAAWQELLEKDDRTSPEEYPEMALITRDELASYMRRTELARRSPSPDAEAARREAIEEAAKVADAYAARMRTSAEKPHPITGRENIIAICKADAGESLAKAIRALSPPVEGE